MPADMAQLICHCEERSDEAISLKQSYAVSSSPRLLPRGSSPRVAMTRICEMPRVILSGMMARRFTGGETVFEVEADTVRRMIAELDRRFPGLGNQIDEGMAVAIDGEIYQDAWQAPLGPDSEIVLIPKIGGG